MHVGNTEEKIKSEITKIYKNHYFFKSFQQIFESRFRFEGKEEEEEVNQNEKR